jgi:hypothetical protein
MPTTPWKGTFREPPFRIRETVEWKQHAGNLEKEMLPDSPAGFLESGKGSAGPRWRPGSMEAAGESAAPVRQDTGKLAKAIGRLCGLAGGGLK